MTYQDEVLADGPVVYFRLGDSGSTMVDWSGNVRNGTYVSTPTLLKPGAIAGDSNTAVKFTRTQSEYATFPNTGLPQGSSAYTLEAWVKTDLFDENQAIVSIGTSGSSRQSNAMRLGLTLDGEATINNYWWAVDLVVPATGYKLSEFNHVVSTFNGTTRTIYLNGVAKGSDTPGLPNVVQSSPTVGRIPNGTPYGYADSTIDEVAIYTYALSPERIMTHYTAGSGDTGGTATPFRGWGIPL